jgi:D-3-phosphoglycerate dehydrogenase
MTDPVLDALILDLLAWLAIRDRNYDEVMDAWRTSCPKLPVWEEANDRGLVERVEASGRSIVRISSSGRALLRRRRSSQSDRPGATARSI